MCLHVSANNVCLYSVWHNSVLLLTDNMGAVAKQILNNVNTTKELTVFFCADSSEGLILSDLSFSQL